MSSLQTAYDSLSANTIPPFATSPSLLPAKPKSTLRNRFFAGFGAMLRGHQQGREDSAAETKVNEERLDEFIKLCGAPVFTPEKVEALAGYRNGTKMLNGRAGNLILHYVATGRIYGEDYLRLRYLILLEVICKGMRYGDYDQVIFEGTEDYVAECTQLSIQGVLLRGEGAMALIDAALISGTGNRRNTSPKNLLLQQEWKWVQAHWEQHAGLMNPADPEQAAAIPAYITIRAAGANRRGNDATPSVDPPAYYAEVLKLRPATRRALFTMLVSMENYEYNLDKKMMSDKDLWRKDAGWDAAKLTDVVKLLQKKGRHYRDNLPGVLVPPIRKILKERSTGAKELYLALAELYELLRNGYNEKKTVPNLLKLYAIEGEKLGPKTTVATYEQLCLVGAPLSNGGYTNYGNSLFHDMLRNGFTLLSTHVDCDIISVKQQGLQAILDFHVKEEKLQLEFASEEPEPLLKKINEVLVARGIGYQLTLMNKGQKKYQSPQGFWDFGKYQLVLVNKETATALNGTIATITLMGFPKLTQTLPAFLLTLKEAQRQQITRNKVVDLENDPAFGILSTVLKDIPKKEEWAKIVGHCQQYPIDSKPAKGWVKTSGEYFDKLGGNDFSTGLITIIDKLIPQTEWFRADAKLRILRGLTWCCRLGGGSAEIYALQRVATKAYRKVPGGPINAKLGNVALESLVAIGSLPAYGTMNNMETKATYSVFRRAVTSRKKKFTALLKQFTPEELDERSIPDFGFVDGLRTVAAGEYKAIFLPVGLKVKLEWETAAGKRQKSVPATLKTEQAALVKSLKAEAKNIGETLVAQATRLERGYLSQKRWAVANWETLLFQHPLMHLLASHLIWQCGDQSFTIHGQQLVGHDGKALTLAAEEVTLWHPAAAPTAETLAWRNYLFAQQIQQPFKQAFREVYILTPAEEITHDHSLRFANHFLRGRTLYSVGKNRGWTVGYQEAPHKYLPEADLTVAYNVEGEPLFGDCLSRELTFFRGKQHYGNHRLPVAEVPAVVLSEIMRDVDLFVAVAGIVADAPMAGTLDDARRNYWHEVSTGKRSNSQQVAVRRDLLERILPLTKLRKVARLEGNFLHVDGKVRNYTINLGTGHSFLKPNDQYLCIVPGTSRAANGVWLPFASEDRTLTMILSKAFLLAADEKITDRTILAQLQRS